MAHFFYKKNLANGKLQYFRQQNAGRCIKQFVPEMILLYGRVDDMSFNDRHDDDNDDDNLLT